MKEKILIIEDDFMVQTQLKLFYPEMDMRFLQLQIFLKQSSKQRILEEPRRNVIFSTFEKVIKSYQKVCQQQTEASEIKEDKKHTV